MKHLLLFLVALLLVGCRLAGAPGATSPEVSASPVRSVPGDTNPPGPLSSDESNTRSFTPMIESPEIGVDYDVYLSLHCGYANVQQVAFGGRRWRFTENGSADSIFVEGILRLVSADSARLTVDGIAHPLIPVTDVGGPICV